ncbi:Threonine dehydrogenase and related Zn-dependent dehydrogenases [Hyphomicrobiales bacterium]|nr:Threonine dehydrogenase and related Zn-dependent dehydrogenases [Hyphomicrobiales bacterium]CAH1699718.1 Threonine dehydrogenase and related Zn-dependent dehydrogenases [Hyphomicrobiales bacterium]
MWSVSFAPLVPLPLLIGLAVLAALAAGAAVVLAGRGAILRALALVVLTLALADPSLVFEDREPVKDVVSVVVDRSASNRLADRSAQTDAAVAEVERQLRGIPNIEPRIVELRDAQGASDGTRLFEALSSSLADVPSERVAGAITITDGLAHDTPANAEALGLRAPLHVLTTGRNAEIDRRIVLVDSPRFGIVGKDQVIRLRVVDKNGASRAGLTIRRDGEIIARRDVATGQIVQVPIRIDRGGPNVVEIEAAPLDNELTLANNRAVITIEGVRDKLRVLLVSGEPHPGERTWRNLLKADANVDLVHFTILRPPEKQDGTPINELSLIAFPTRELFQVKIKEFDLIIFDRYANQSILPLLYFENIVRYVRDGGALLVAAGPEYAGSQTLARTPLGQILPAVPDGSVIDEAYRAQVSEPGKRHPVTRDLPGSDVSPPRWGEWLRMVGAQARAGAAPVMTGPGERPLLMLAREQKGRVALFLSDHAWLWARGFRDGGPYLDLLRRLSHWLMKEPELEEEALRATARGGTIEIERQTLSDNPAPVTVTGPDGQSRSITLEAGRPGLFTARLPASDQGLYRLTADNLTAFASVGPENPRELMEVVSDPAALQHLAQATGGSSRRIGHESGSGVTVPRIVPVRSGSQLAGNDWIGLRISDSGIVRGVQISPLFVGLLGLAILFGALVAGWLGESGRRLRRQA